jgi:hypothetical protein
LYQSVIGVRRRLLTLAISATLLATTAGACGEGDDEAADAGSPITKSEFIRMASRACKDEREGLKKRAAELARQYGSKPRPYYDVVHTAYLPTIEVEIDAIEELEIPPGQEKKIEAILDIDRRGVDSVAVIPRVRSIDVAEREFAAANKLFRAYGLTACGPELAGQAVAAGAGI